ncbi:MULTISPECIES: 6-phospho-3-hexuloisomerase [Methanobacterium]|jgi:6-phospho-3-hexuloisomerase|uniref:6-phospho-3-hexuloisomerase n=1 Tax=Methanobacterium formicicum TaxID=2162 RepID=A0A843AVU2_METFO|nr:MULTISPECIES: 6-phospho-3-hexuloisomerase [Methanobacterium]KUK74585.1 MAG: 6-phospho 3-hexuloisomerase [Methanobacterium sp. 42_16]MBF4475653.1 6-phospho-3-hexuloisomerase [Methanobacterium formicicum]MDD4810527.1 6-phospho-3-hexuloisomerase [Methanobacterium formicicum]MDG3547739.1 6-phospho-3-hexuloisomerase [Methanobacterium formicicum]
MEYLKKTVEGIAKHALEVIGRIDFEQVEQMIQCITESNSTFIVGSGRSELVGKAFAMRLMHLGFTVHVVGDVTTPALTQEDCLIAISGSGETKTVTLAAETASEVGTKVIGITTDPQSTLGKNSDVVVNIDSKSKVPWKYYTSHVLKGNYDDLTPMGTLFEDSSHLFLDGLIAEFMVRLNKKEDDLQRLHARD